MFDALFPLPTVLTSSPPSPPPPQTKDDPLLVAELSTSSSDSSDSDSDRGHGAKRAADGDRVSKHNSNGSSMKDKGKDNEKIWRQYTDSVRQAKDAGKKRRKRGGGVAAAGGSGSDSNCSAASGRSGKGEKGNSRHRQQHRNRKNADAVAEEGDNEDDSDTDTGHAADGLKTRKNQRKEIPESEIPAQFTAGEAAHVPKYDKNSVYTATANGGLMKVTAVPDPGKDTISIQYRFLPSAKEIAARAAREEAANKLRREQVSTTRYCGLVVCCVFPYMWCGAVRSVVPWCAADEV